MAKSSSAMIPQIPPPKKKPRSLLAIDPKSNQSNTEHEEAPACWAGGIYEEFLTFTPENYGDELMDFKQVEDTIPAPADNVEIAQQGLAMDRMEGGLAPPPPPASPAAPAASSAGMQIAHQLQLRCGSSPEVDAEPGATPAGDAAAQGCGRAVCHVPRGYSAVRPRVTELPQPSATPAGDAAGAYGCGRVVHPALPGFSFSEVDAGLAARPGPPRSLDDIDPSTATDAEVLDFVRAKSDGGVEVNDGGLAERDPTNLNGPLCYLTSNTTVYLPKREGGTGRILPGDKKQNGGYWKELGSKIVSDGDEMGGFAHDLGTSTAVAGFLSRIRGIKRTLQFINEDGTKTNWRMHEYIPLDAYNMDLFFKGKLVLRKVFEMNDKNGSSKEDINDELGGIAAEDDPEEGAPHDLSKTRGKSSRAWQCFYKIYDSHPQHKGAKLAYALCRSCSVVLKANNGTRSLLRHCEETCPNKHSPTSGAALPLPGPGSSAVVNAGDLSTATDEEILDIIGQPGVEELLRSKYDHALAEKDPTVLELSNPNGPQCYFIGRGVSNEIPSGYWKEKKDYYKIVSNNSGLAIGMKRTLQFCKNDNSKTDWLIEEHIPLDNWLDGHMFFKGETVLRRVFKMKDKSSSSKDRAPDNGKTTDVKTSSVWQHFFKIFDGHPEEKAKLVYALCRHCPTVLKAATVNGTTSLLRHCNKHLMQLTNTSSSQASVSA